MYIYNGIYSKRSYTVKKTVSSGILASVLFYAFVYFIPNLAFSRIAFGISAAVVTVALVVWREILPLMVKGVKKITFVPERTVVIGDNEVASTLIKNLEASNTAEVIGVVWSGYGKRPGHFDGYPVIGYLDTIGTIIEKVNPDIIIIATNKPWYSQIIEALAVNKVKHLSVKWVPHEIFEVDKRELPDTIPLKNFSV
jgi:FlaA1/EpsC-like NDP-sugar epimerase